MAPSRLTNSVAGFEPATAVAEFVDPYLDPGTGLLRNLVGAATQADLDSREAELTAFAAVELALQPVKITADLRQLSAIHRRLFQDVYDWAGKLRTVDMRKGNDPSAEFFMPVSRLETGAGFVFQDLADDNMRGVSSKPAPGKTARTQTPLDSEAFVSKLAHHFDQLNYLHPFREGNGRTQRIFWSQIAGRAGYELDWKKVSGQEVNQASRDAMETQDLEGLRLMFTAISTRRADPTVATVATLKDRFRRHPELRDIKLDPHGLDAAEGPTPDTDNEYRQ